VVTSPERLGKSQALNKRFAESDTSIVVISDANNRLAPGAQGCARGAFRRSTGGLEGGVRRSALG
jgi:hypothetical protein